MNVYLAAANKKRLGATPDESLAKRRHAPPVVPLVQRAELPDLPDSELLTALHYYIAMTYPEKAGVFDESALITLGMLVDKWVEESITENEYKDYIKEIPKDDLILEEKVHKKKKSKSKSKSKRKEAKE